jgi:hypothetical protein
MQGRGKGARRHQMLDHRETPAGVLATDHEPIADGVGST